MIFFITEAGEFIITEDGRLLVFNKSGVFSEIKSLFAVSPRIDMFSALPRTINFTVSPRTPVFEALPRTINFTVSPETPVFEA